MKERKYNESLYYVFDNFKFDKIDHLFSSRICWENENEKINKIFNTDKKVISLKQVHGNNVEIVDEVFLNNYKEDVLIEGDGLITILDSVILKTYHADCTPLYFVDSKKEIIGVAHAGWKGTYQGILEEMVNKMIGIFNSNVKDIYIYIGPAIKSCCYEVGEDLFDNFYAKYKKASDAFKIKSNKYYLDTQAINLFQAKNIGIPIENITTSDLCTGCNTDKLYSYRKENGSKGRLITAITKNK